MEGFCTGQNTFLNTKAHCYALKQYTNKLDNVPE